MVVVVVVVLFIYFLTCVLWLKMVLITQLLPSLKGGNSLLRHCPLPLKQKNRICSKAALENGELRAEQACGVAAPARSALLAGIHLRCLGRHVGRHQET